MQPQAPSQALPADFDGTFRFTNWTDTDFTAKWGGKEYTFLALKTTPLIILSATPYEIQYIRKKFAKELAEREFFKSQKYKDLDGKNKGDVNFHSAVSYTGNDLESFVQRCLEPLPEARAIVTEVPKQEFVPKATKRIKSRQSGDDSDESLVQSQGSVIA